MDLCVVGTVKQEHVHAELSQKETGDLQDLHISFVGQVSDDFVKHVSDRMSHWWGRVAQKSPARV